MLIEMIWKWRKKSINFFSQSEKFNSTFPFIPISDWSDAMRPEDRNCRSDPARVSVALMQQPVICHHLWFSHDSWRGSARPKVGEKASRSRPLFFYRGAAQDSSRRWRPAGDAQLGMSTWFMALSHTPLTPLLFLISRRSLSPLHGADEFSFFSPGHGQKWCHHHRAETEAQGEGLQFTGPVHVQGPEGSEAVMRLPLLSIRCIGRLKNK